MSSIQTAIQLNDQFTGVIYGIINSVNLAISGFEDMQSTMNANIDISSLEGARDELNQVTAELNELNATPLDIGADEVNAGLKQAIREQERFNSTIEQGSDAASKLKQAIAGAIGAYAGVAGVRKVIGVIQDTTAAFDTQRNAEMQLMTVLNNMLDTDYVAEFQLDVDTTAAEAHTNALLSEFDAITKKASEIQSRGIYGDEAMIGAAGEFATYMSDPEAIQTMMDTLTNYAMGMSGGGAVDQTQMVDYATNLGKIMTGAYDAMTKKGFEFTDAQKAVIDGTATESQYIEALGENYAELSEDMQAASVIADIINESWAGLYETMSDTPQGKIIQMTNAFGDMKEMIGAQLYPFVIRFVDVILENSDTITAVINGFVDGLQFIMGVLSSLMGIAFDVASVIIDNWSIIEPIIWGVAGALGAYYGAQLLANGVALIGKGIHIAMAFAQMAHAAMTGALTEAIAAEIAAQNGLNTAMYACPIVWIIMLIIALIAVIFAVCSAIAKLTGVASSGFGVLCGVVNVSNQLFKNLLLTAVDVAIGVQNATEILAANIKAVFHNAISNVQAWWYDLLSTCITVIAGICAELNKLPFVEFDYSGITNAANEYAAKSAEAAGNKEEYQSISDAFKEGFNTFDTFQDGWLSDAFETGVARGDALAEKISNFSLSDLFKTPDIPDVRDYAAGFGDALTESGMGDTLDSIAGNTGSIKDALDITEEDLKYMRDLAEQEAVNRYTVAEISVDMSGMQNNISSDNDIDGFMTKLTDAVNEAVDSMTEGVHE